MVRTALALAIAALLASIAWQPAASCEDYEQVRTILKGNVFLDGTYGHIYATDPDDSHMPVGEPRGRITTDRGSYALRGADHVVIAAIEPSLRIRFSPSECDGYQVQIYPATLDIYVVANRGRLIGTITGRLPENNFICSRCDRAYRGRMSEETKRRLGL